MGIACCHRAVCTNSCVLVHTLCRPVCAKVATGRVAISGSYSLMPACGIHICLLSTITINIILTINVFLNTMHSLGTMFSGFNMCLSISAYLFIKRRTVFSLPSRKETYLGLHIGTCPRQSGWSDKARFKFGPTPSHSVPHPTQQGF